MRVFSPLKLPNGEPVYSQEYAQTVRAEKNKRRIIDQLGGQENMLASPADLIIGGGCRGGSKSYSLLLEALKDVMNRNFRAVILRNEKPDLEDIVEVSHEVYGQFGAYNKSKNDMTWNFDSGAILRFSYYADEFEEFKKRFQGKQFAYIGIDEITHCPFKKFKYLLTDNRNAYGIRSRFWGTCNPDPDSWVATFLFDGGWLDRETGFPIPEMDGVIRYFYSPSNEVSEIVWGDTREEVFEMCKEDILKHWNESYATCGTPAEIAVKSCAFVEAKLADNRILLESDPGYVGNLMNQDEEQQSRDLDGNWKFRSAGDDLIKMEDMLNFFDNSIQCEEDDEDYASADVALQGGDNFFMWHWKGNHVADAFVGHFDSKTLVDMIKFKLNEWGVQEENFTYDFQGIGQILEGHFPDAVKFINQAAPMPEDKSQEESIKKAYKDLKSQCAVLFYKQIRNGELSIDKRLLDTVLGIRGRGKMTVRDMLMRERKCIRRTVDSIGKAFQIISKHDMKKIIGYSPDGIESLMFKQIFRLRAKKHKKAKNTWCI